MRIKFKMDLVLRNQLSDIIYDHYVWESIEEHESAMKDDSSPSAPLPHYIEIFHNLVIAIKSCEELLSDRSQNMWNVSFSSECREDKYVFHDLSNLSYYLSKNIEGEIYHSPSSPL